MRGKQISKISQFLFASIKSKDPMQKYPYINELFDCTEKMLAFIFLFSINSLISSGMCSKPKLLE